MISPAVTAPKSIPSGTPRTTKMDKRSTYFEQYANRGSGDDTHYGDSRVNVDTYGTFIDFLQRMLDHCEQQIEMNT